VDFSPIMARLLGKIRFHGNANILTEAHVITAGWHFCQLRQFRDDIGVKNRIDG
jgi:hypothetical protein